MTSDLELIKSIKGKNDSAALTELVARHTGIYATIVNQYAGYSSAVNRNDMLDERLFNIWEYAKDFRPECGMKFSTYVGERVKYACKTLLSQTKNEEVDVNNQLPAAGDFVHVEEARDDIAEILKHTDSKKDRVFRRIMKMRSEDEKATWVEIGRAVGLSYEGARKLYHRRLKELKRRVLK